MKNETGKELCRADRAMIAGASIEELTSLLQEAAEDNSKLTAALVSAIKKELESRL